MAGGPAKPRVKKIVGAMRGLRGSEVALPLRPDHSLHQKTHHTDSCLSAFRANNLRTVQRQGNDGSRSAVVLSRHHGPFRPAIVGRLGNMPTAPQPCNSPR